MYMCALFFIPDIVDYVSPYMYPHICMLQKWLSFLEYNIILNRKTLLIIIIQDFNCNKPIGSFTQSSYLPTVPHHFAVSVMSEGCVVVWETATLHQHNHACMSHDCCTCITHSVKLTSHITPSVIPYHLIISVLFLRWVKETICSSAWSEETSQTDEATWLPYQYYHLCTGVSLFTIFPWLEAPLKQN